MDEKQLHRMMELHISPNSVAKAAFKAAIRRVERGQALQERKAGLEAVQRLDPRITDRELKSSSSRVYRLRRKASVYESSIGV